MKVLIVQTDIVWEDVKANLDKLEDKLAGANTVGADLVVLPEMFSTGFTMNSAAMAETMEGETVSWMKRLSNEGNFALAGSIIVLDDGKYYNRLIFCSPEGIQTSYDKGHLFRMEKENSFFTKGDKRVTASYGNYSINLQICYDLRFPVWSRRTGNNYDILLYVANWPESRRKVWKTLLKARAIENQCYVIGVNRTGKDGNGLSYSGDSVIIDPKGQIMASLDKYEEGIASASLSLDKLYSFRDKFPVWKDADRFELL